jgi:UDP-MurNAc hydroxylase
MDRIVWINHAGFELQTNGIRIVCDPWLSGLAFYNSWALLSETVYKPCDFRGVDYLWLSHEHPDHFSPANIRSIPIEIRATIVVLFQRTKDGRVANFCRNLGFKAVYELSDWEKIDLGHGVYFTLKTVDDDSLCFIETPQAKYLNINDCVSAHTKALHEMIAANIGKPDVLFSQFSFANWAGNPGDVKRMRAMAAEKINDIDIQLSIYEPKILIPFASFTWFCRSDNFHLNQGANRISDVYARFKDRISCVVLYPGDVHNVGATHDASNALKRYAADEARHISPLDIQEESNTLEQLVDLSAEHKRNIQAKNSLWVFWPLRLVGYVKPITIHLTDINRSVSYSMFDGTRPIAVSRSRCDLEFTSTWLAYLLRYGTGYDTLYISGRFAENRVGAQFDLSRNFVILRRNAHGQFFPSTFFNARYVGAKLRILVKKFW